MSNKRLKKKPKSMRKPKFKSETITNIVHGSYASKTYTKFTSSQQSHKRPSTNKGHRRVNCVSVSLDDENDDWARGNIK